MDNKVILRLSNPKPVPNENQLIVLRLCFFCGSLFLYLEFVCYTALSVACSHVVASCEMTKLLGSLVCDVFLYLCHFSVWCPGLCVLFDCIDS